MAPPTDDNTEKPQFESSISDHPALHPDVTNVPVTPGVHLSGKTAYFDEKNSKNTSSLPFDPETATPGPSWSANSYFSNQQRVDHASASTEKAAGAQSGE